jgi:glutamate/tyrosine decarboxylase-like PLP-dependent enzyme
MVTDTYVGTRPGGAVASAWAVMHYLGRAGYEAVATRVLDMVDSYLEGIRQIGDLVPVCQPDLSIVSFNSPSVSTAALAEGLEARGWLVNTCREPSAIHSMMSLLHEPIREQYLSDLSDAFEHAKSNDVVGDTTERAYS